MANKIWCVGDIHGCYDELIALWQKLPIDVENDLVIFMGDYIDRGPDSRKVVEQLIKWHKKYEHWVFLFGNHESILKNWIEGRQKYQENDNWSCFFYNGGKETIKSYGKSEAFKIRIPLLHEKFLFEKTKMLYETDNYVFVHAGLVPGLPISEHLSKQEYINAMLWAREGFIESNWNWGKKVVFGHTPAYNPKWGEIGKPIIMTNKIGIDGAVCPSANKNLIAVELPAEKFYFQESFAIYNSFQNI